MGVNLAISVEDYLRSSFPGPDPEFRDGETLERQLPDYLHGKCQLLLGAFFLALRKSLFLYPCSETRVRLRQNLVLIPDIAVFYPEEPSRVPDSPPLVVAEILSVDDRLSEVRQKLEEYRAWGVPHVWLVDPHSRRLYTCDEGLREVEALFIPELGISVQPGDVFD